MALITNDVFDVARTVSLSRATRRHIRQNLFFAFICNGLGIPVATGLLHPVFGILLSPMIAAAATAASSTWAVPKRAPAPSLPTAGITRAMSRRR